MPETCIGKLEMTMCPHLVVNPLNRAETKIESIFIRNMLLRIKKKGT